MQVDVAAGKIREIKKIVDIFNENTMQIQWDVL